MIDDNTMVLLQHQGRRMHQALHETYPPNRKLAREIQERVDTILDARPRVHAVAPDGEVVWSNAPEWQKAQVEPAPLPALPNTVFGSLTGEVEEPKGTASGGVGLLEPPPTKELTPEQERDIEHFKKGLGL